MGNEKEPTKPGRLRRRFVIPFTFGLIAGGIPLAVYVAYFSPTPLLEVILIVLFLVAADAASIYLLGRRHQKGRRT